MLFGNLRRTHMENRISNGTFTCLLLPANFSFFFSLLRMPWGPFRGGCPMFRVGLQNNRTEFCYLELLVWSNSSLKSSLSKVV